MIDDETDESEDDKRDIRSKLQEKADEAVDEFDDRLIDILSWVLDTETSARIYIYLRANPQQTSEEIADGTGLYPSTVREALSELHDEGPVTREKRELEGAGNNPYEYSAIPPSELVTTTVSDIQAELNTIVNLDNYLKSDTEEDRSYPITISVNEGDEDEEEESEVEEEPEEKGNEPVDIPLEEEDEDGKSEGEEIEVEEREQEDAESEEEEPKGEGQDQ